MTDQELKDLVASLAIDRKETDKKIAKMSERVDRMAGNLPRSALKSSGILPGIQRL
jgi:hypothetical protein